METLKTVISDRLASLSSSDKVSSPIIGDIRSVYIDCDQEDLDSSDIDLLYNWLTKQFRVVLPDFAAGGLSQSEVMMAQCEGVLIYHGRASGLWLRRRLLSLKKTRYRRNKPLLAKAIYIAKPTTPEKQIFLEPDMLLIDGLERFDAQLLLPFLENLQEEV